MIRCGGTRAVQGRNENRSPNAGCRNFGVFQLLGSSCAARQTSDDQQARCIPKLTAHCPGPVVRQRLNVDVVLLGVVDDRQNQLTVGADAATRSPRRAWRNQWYDDRAGFGGRAAVNVGTARRQGNVTHRQFVTHQLPAEVETKVSDTTVIRVTRSGHFSGTGQRNGERDTAYPSGASQGCGAQCSEEQQRGGDGAKANAGITILLSTGTRPKMVIWEVSWDPARRVCTGIRQKS